VSLETTIFLLLVAHAVLDFVWQPDVMAMGKSRHYALHKNPDVDFPPWYYWLTSHAFAHGGMVFMITGSLMLGVIEVCLHWLIDFIKCEKWITLHQDQLLHMLCKAYYCIYLFYL